MNQIRTFIAIEIPDSIKHELAKLQEKLKNEHTRISWVKPHNIHITLKFLGDVDLGLIEALAEAVVNASKEIKPFSIEIGGVGVFPNVKRPRVIWVGAKSTDDNLTTIAEKINHEVHKLGFEKESRRFTAHLTIGRVKDTRDIETVIRLLEEHKNFNGGGYLANEIIVMRSDLKPTGAVYTPLKKVILDN